MLLLHYRGKICLISFKIIIKLELSLWIPKLLALLPKLLFNELLITLLFNELLLLLPKLLFNELLLDIFLSSCVTCWFNIRNI